MNRGLLPWCLLIIGNLLFCIAGAQNLKVSSPNESIKVVLSVKDEITFSITCIGQKILEEGTISLELSDETIGQNPKLLKQVDREIGFFKKSRI